MSNKKKATPLTEKEVHNECNKMLSMGEDPTTLTLYDRLKRGSNSTISKYLKTWKSLYEQEKEKIENLPVAVSVPNEVSKVGDDFVKTCWAAAQRMSEKLMESERERIKQADLKREEDERVSNAFSEKQAADYQKLSEEFNELSDDRDNALNEIAGLKERLSAESEAKANVEKDYDVVVNEMEALSNIITELEQTKALLEQEKEQLIEQSKIDIKAKNDEIVKLNKAHDLAIVKIEAKHEKNVERLTVEHGKSVNDLKAVHDKSLVEINRAHDKIVKQYESTIKSLTDDKNKQNTDIKELQSNVKELQKNLDAEKNKVAKMEVDYAKKDQSQS
jgi:chromosome segregation ATPase